VRKAVLIVGMLFGLAVFGASQTTDPVRAIFWISIALGGLASAAPVGWSIASPIAPKGGAGTIGGIMNFANNLMGAAAPIVTGFIVGATKFVCQRVVRRRRHSGDRHRLVRLRAWQDRTDPRSAAGRRAGAGHLRP
jgi:MFS family permease